MPGAAPNSQIGANRGDLAFGYFDHLHSTPILWWVAKNIHKVTPDPAPNTAPTPTHTPTPSPN